MATVSAVASTDEKALEIDGHELLISHPDKVFFSEHGETKLDLVNHYLRFAEPLMRTMGGRPTLMQRFPEGAGGSSFFQKRVPKSAPDWLQTTIVSTPNGTTSRALVAVDLAHVVWAVNIGCLGFHVWPYLADDPEHTDELRLDLDPQPGNDFTHIRAAAAKVRAFLDELGIVGYPKTTGNRGVHVYIRLEPRWDSYDVRRAAVAAARELERRHPDLMTAAWWKEERGERVFLDFNQNAPHKTVFGAWSVRARVGAQVSTPLFWDEIDEIHPDELTISTLPARIETHGDPWADMNDRYRTTIRSRWSRSSRCTRRTAPTGSWTRRGRPSTRSSPTSRRASRPAAPARSNGDSPPVVFVSRPRDLLRAKDLADARYFEPLGVDDLARAAGFSRAHFSREFRRTFGEAPHSYLLTRRLERAAALLRNTDGSVIDTDRKLLCWDGGTGTVKSTVNEVYELVQAHAPGFGTAS